MIIESVEPNSIAAELEFQSGDELIAIDKQPVRDIIDYRFLISDEYISLELKRKDTLLQFDIEKDFDEDLGISFEPVKYRSCGNNCIFCFVDQNPGNLRSNLYFKDEDFRLSFLHGNYVTLTNISQNDIDRIVRQRLTPLYISVHATDTIVRKRLLGIRGNDRLLEKIQILVNNNIELHTQIVLCPGINDGAVLTKTIQDLRQFYPKVKTIAIVPLGLTRHRDKLVRLRPVTAEFSIDLIQTIDPLAQNYYKKDGSYFVYLADEFYINANITVPQAVRYDQFEQYENGVGMLRYLMDEFESSIPTFPLKLDKPTTVRLITAKLAASYLKQRIVPQLRNIKNLTIDMSVITNNFYGDSVRVTGLLTGQDIYQQVAGETPVDCVVLPANCLNSDGLFLDDWTIPQLSEKLGQRIAVLGVDFSELFTYL